MQFDNFMIRRKIFAFLGKTFHFKDPQGNVFAYCHQKAFKLKEDIRIYTDDTKTEEILLIKARNIIDFSAAYDVADSKTGEIIGTWRRKGFSSLIRDSWELLIAGSPIGQLKEDSMLLALIRRFLCNLVPQSYHLVNASGVMMANFHQHFNPFVFKLDVVNLAPGNDKMAKLIAAGGVLLSAIEGRQG